MMLAAAIIIFAAALRRQPAISWRLPLIFSAPLADAADDITPRRCRHYAITILFSFLSIAIYAFAIAIISLDISHILFRHSWPQLSPFSALAGRLAPAASQISPQMPPYFRQR
jgi:hypothetical protein